MRPITGANGANLDRKVAINAGRELAVLRCARLIQTPCFASASELRRDSALRPHFERQGKALINFKTSKPDNVHYSLDCTNGHFSGVAQTALSPQGGFCG